MLEFLDFIRHHCTAGIVYNIKFCHLINQCRMSRPNQILGCQFKHLIVTILCYPLCFLREKFHLIKIALFMNVILRLFLFIFAVNEMSETFVLNVENEFNNDYQ